MTDSLNQGPLHCSHCGENITGAYRAYKDEAFHTSPECSEAHGARMREAAVVKADAQAWDGIPEGYTPAPELEPPRPDPDHAWASDLDDPPERWSREDLVDAGQLELRLPGVKADQGKLRYDLLPPEAEEDLVRAITYGAAKYTDEGWRTVPNGRSRYFAALRRHMNAWRRGERMDPDSGLPHLACAGACLVFLLELDRE